MNKDFHAAIILDGNGRWAKQRGKPRLFGHAEGAKTLKTIIKACPANNIRYLTVYVFSSENWSRPESEVSGLMGMLSQYLKKETQSMHKEGVCFRAIGNRDMLSKEIQNLIRETEDLTKDNTKLGLQVALSYGARDEIARAVRKIAGYVAAGKINPNSISADTVSDFLDTKGIPDPHVIIRTSGEKRMSNFLAWQSAYSELVFIDKYWPDFSETDLQNAINEYLSRERRFGYAA